MSGPWEKYQTQDDGPWAKYQAQVEPVTMSAAPDLPKGFTIGGLPLVSDKGVWADVKRSFGLAGRSALNTVASLPLAAANLGVGTRNLILGEQNELPSTTWNQSLTNAGLPEASGKLEKTADFIDQIVAGSKLPAPAAGDKMGGLAGQALPKLSINPAAVNQQRLATLKQAQEAGYAVPPSTTNPTVKNKILESIAGKVATQQDAREIADVATRHAAQADLALHPSQDVTLNALNAIRTEASPAYEAIKNAGEITPGPAYQKALDAISSKYEGASKSFPGLQNDEVSKIVDALRQPKFDADSAVDATKVLREKAGDAYSAGNKTLGKAYRSASDALENAIEAHLAKSGTNEASATLKNFRDARQLIAKTYTVEKALNDASGQVSATKLGQMLTRGKPMSGELQTAAEFGQAFPKLGVPLTDSGSVRHTDTALAMVAAALSHDPRALAFPFGRMALRKYLLSNPNLAMPTQGVANIDPAAMGSAQAISNALLGQ